MSTKQILLTVLVAVAASLATRVLPVPVFAQNQRLQAHSAPDLRPLAQHAVRAGDQDQQR